MAGILIEKKRWLIVPSNVIERSALLRLPARKWMMIRNMFVVPATASNARALMAEVDSRQIEINDDLRAVCADLMKPLRTDRQWPAWYKFNNTKFSPLDHQYDALKRIYPLNAGALLMAMGTCKTRIAIDLMSAHFYEQRIQFVICICPLTVKVTTWVDELKNFSPCPYEFIDVDSSFDFTRMPPLKADTLYWFMVGIESLSQGRTYDRLLPITHWDKPYAVVVDESSRIANFKAICTDAATKLRERAALRLIMTGTELKRNVEDLYSQFEFLDPSIVGVGDYYAFRNRYCIMGGYKGKQVVGYNNFDELLGLISPHVFQADKSMLKLPPKVYEVRAVKLQPEQLAMYKKIKNAELEGFDVKNILKKTLRLQQITCGYIKTDRWQIDPDTLKKTEVEVQTIEVVPPSRNPKLQELLRVCDETSHPMIIWSTSLYEIGIIEAALSKRGRVLKIVGDIPAEERHGIVTEFQTGRVPYFVGTAASGGIGTTLTAARTVVYFSNNQMLVDRLQSEDRAHRKGQTHSVTYIDLVATGTVDVPVLRNLRDKKDLADYVKDQIKNRIALERFFDGRMEEVPETLEQPKKISAKRQATGS